MVQDHVAATVHQEDVADRLRHLRFDVLQLWDGDAEIDIRPGGDEAQQAGRHVLDDGPFDPVQIGPPRLPVIRVAGHPYDLVRPEFDEFEWARTDRVTAHVARRDVTGIDRRPAGR